MQAYEDKRSRERDNRSDSMCTSFSFARVQTSIPRAPVEPHVQIKLMFYEPDPLGVDNLTNIAVATITRQKTYDRAGNIQHTHFAHVELALGHDLTGNAFETNPVSYTQCHDPISSHPRLASVKHVESRLGVTLHGFNLMKASLPTPLSCITSVMIREQ